MGTRHLIAVFVENEYRVAQYCQFDGYPEGSGIECLKFVRDRMNDKFKENVMKCSFYTGEEITEIYRKYNKRTDGMISLDDYERVCKDYPVLDRSFASHILDYIQESNTGCKLENEIEFASDSLFCEYAYVIDLDKNSFEVYFGFNKTPLTEADRFYWMEDKCRDGYHCIKLAKMWDLNDLPNNDKFIEELTEEE